MQDKTNVTIVVPIFNMERYLERCLDSISYQTYMNFEVVMIDDGSVDNSKDICLKYQQEDNRFSYYYQDNRGVSSARNKGIELARGEWICFVDPDDYLRYDFIEQLYSKVEEQSDIIVCCCMAEKDGQLFENTFFPNDIIFESNKYDLFMQLLDNNYQSDTYRYTAVGVPWGKLYCKKFLNEYNVRFDVELKRMQDNIFNFGAFRYAKKIRYINYMGYYYVVDHVTTYAKKFDEEAYIYLPKIITHQKRILEDMHLLDDGKITSALVKEAVAIYVLAIQKSFFANSHISYIEKCKCCKELIKVEPFQKLFFETKHTKIVKCLIVLVKLDLTGLLILVKNVWKNKKIFQILSGKRGNSTLNKL